MYIFNTEQIYLYGRKVIKSQSGSCQRCSLYSICIFYTRKIPPLGWLLYKCFDPKNNIPYNFQEI